VIDDRPERRALVRQVLIGSGLAPADIVEVADGPAALSVIDAAATGAVVLEIQLPVREGLAAVAALRGRSKRLRIVVCSFHADAATRQLAFEAGADAYLGKPVRAEDMRAALSDDRSPSIGTPRAPLPPPPRNPRGVPDSVVAPKAPAPHGVERREGT
jgi:CheY-like chemotaxis protein